MTIDEFEKKYYPDEEDIKEIAFVDFVRSFAFPNEKVDPIISALYRGGIKTIKDLALANEEDLRKLNNVGKVRLDFILKLKHKIMDETF